MTCPIDEAPEPRPKPVAPQTTMNAAGITLIGTVAPKHEDPLVIRDCVAYAAGSQAPRYLGTINVPHYLIDSIMLFL